ncbi:MAG: O-antigen ligase family protein [bacterium]
MGDTLLVIAIVSCLVIEIIGRVKDGDYHLKSTEIDLPVLLFILLTIVSLVRSLNFYGSLLEAVKVVSYVILFFMVLQHRNREGLARNILHAVLFTGLFVVLYGIYEHVTVVKVLWYPRGMVYSTFPNPNHFGGYVALTLVLAGARLLFDKPAGNERKFLIVLTALCFIGLYSSNSKGAIFSFMAALGVLAAFKGRKLLIIYSLVVLFFIGAFLFALTPLGKKYAPPEFMSDSHTYERLPLWNETLSYIGDYPLFGTGIATFKDYYPQYKSMVGLRSAEFAHNEFLNIWAEMGVFTLFIYVGLIYVFFRRCYGYIKKGDCALGLSKGTLIGIMAAVTAIIAHSTVEFNLHTPAIAVVLVLLGAIVFLNDSSQQVKQIVPLSKIKKYSIYVALILGFITTVVILIVPLKGEYHFRKANDLNKHKEYLDAIVQYEKATRFNPLATAYHERLGDAYLIEGRLLRDGNFIYGAHQEYKKCVMMYPRNVFYRLKLARFYVQFGKLEQALLHYRAVLFMAPNVKSFKIEYDELIRKTRQ